MTRVFVEELLFFFLPFALFAVWLLLARKSPFARAHWSGRVPWIVMAGLVFVVAALLYTGFVAPRGTGAYVPAHMENGQFVPGRIE